MNDPRRGCGSARSPCDYFSFDSLRVVSWGIGFYYY